MGVRVTPAAAKVVDAMVEEYDSTRADVLRALLSEALANPTVLAAARMRLKKAML